MPEPYIGEIRMFGGNFAPAGWAFCNGATLPISENDALFTLIGTTYGGDGQETFSLPNLQSRVPIHMGTGPSGTTYQIGEMAGTEQETLTVQQIPIHSHPMLASTGPGNVNAPGGNVIGESSSVKVLINDSPTGNLNINAVTPVGGSQPHENCQPFLCINFIISLFGVFPSQT
jgi:microcystin-dependent protein